MSRSVVPKCRHTLFLLSICTYVRNYVLFQEIKRQMTDEEILKVAISKFVVRLNSLQKFNFI